ncbi:MAG: Unknown protein [uncultured Sulfurovum sp.]|uniref:Uncharacterized protein n=1 Tax=uncultured Sulfurovum sp. TaxID=269237 RepID=A0A6S6TKR3_9BACT|nr:MAG: Unknown protein [uncultured Sulfurovum sp.]
MKSKIEETESIYLDMNVIVDYMKKRKAFSIKPKESQNIFDFNLDFLIPHQKMNDLKLNFIFPYSPAHIEETANIQRDSKLEKEEALKHITNQLNFILELSKGYEYLPSSSAILLKKEHPLECYKRVIKDYALTIEAEENEKFKESFRDEKSYKEFHNETTPSSIHIPMYEKIQEEYKINKKKLIDLPVNEVLKDKNVLTQTAS